MPDATKNSLPHPTTSCELRCPCRGGGHAGRWGLALVPRLGAEQHKAEGPLAGHTTPIMIHVHYIYLAVALCLGLNLMDILKHWQRQLILVTIAPPPGDAHHLSQDCGPSKALESSASCMMVRRASSSCTHGVRCAQQRLWARAWAGRLTGRALLPRPSCALRLRPSARRAQPLRTQAPQPLLLMAHCWTPRPVCGQARWWRRSLLAPLGCGQCGWMRVRRSG